MQNFTLDRETLKMKVVLGLELCNLLLNTTRIIYANTYDNGDIFDAKNNSTSGETATLETTKKVRTRLRILRIQIEGIDDQIDWATGEGHVASEDMALAFASGLHARLGAGTFIHALPEETVKKICDKLPHGPPPIMRIFSDLGAHNLSQHMMSKIHGVKLVLKRSQHARVHPVSRRYLERLTHCLQHSRAETRDCIILPQHFLKLHSLIIFKTPEDWNVFCETFRDAFKQQKQHESASHETDAKKLQGQAKALEQDAKTMLGRFGYAPLQEVSDEYASGEMLFEITRYNAFVQRFYEQVQGNYSVWVFNPERWDNISHNICASDNYHCGKTPKDTVYSTIRLVLQMHESLTKEGINTRNSYYVDWEPSLGPWIHAHMQNSTIAELVEKICEAEQIVI